MSHNSFFLSGLLQYCVIVILQVYSDADIVLSKDWVPPITIAPTQVTPSETDSPARKKTSSVSFSLDSSSEAETGLPPLSSSYIESKEESEKSAESKKNKVTFVESKKKLYLMCSYISFVSDVKKTFLSAVVDGNFSRRQRRGET